MAKGSTQTTQRETMSERIDYLVNMTKGRMPVVIVVKTEAEAEEADTLLKRRKITNLSVKIGK